VVTPTDSHQSNPGSGVPTVGVTRCGIAMVSPLYQLTPPITKCKKLMLRKCVHFEQKSTQAKKSNLSECSFSCFHGGATTRRRSSSPVSRPGPSYPICPRGPDPAPELHGTPTCTFLLRHHKQNGANSNGGIEYRIVYHVNWFFVCLSVCLCVCHHVHQGMETV